MFFLMIFLKGKGCVFDTNVHKNKFIVKYLSWLLLEINVKVVFFFASCRFLNEQTNKPQDRLYFWKCDDRFLSGFLSTFMCVLNKKKYEVGGKMKSDFDKSTRASRLIRKTCAYKFSVKKKIRKNTQVLSENSLIFLNEISGRINVQIFVKKISLVQENIVFFKQFAPKIFFLHLYKKT